MKTLTALLAALSLALAGPTAAQDDAPATAPSCNGPEHRQFDFWIGDWDVSSNGQPAGRNSIQSVHGGCVLLENWQGAGAGGITGSSYNLYDRATGRWHQSWVDSTGNLLLLDGGFEQGSMVLSGSRPGSGDAGPVLHRIRWTPNDDGSVRQLWEASQDQGANWTVLFDGLYVKRAQNP